MQLLVSASGQLSPHQPLADATSHCHQDEQRATTRPDSSQNNRFHTQTAVGPVVRLHERSIVIVSVSVVVFVLLLVTAVPTVVTFVALELANLRLEQQQWLQQ